MELLREDEVRPEPGERVFRHGALGPFVLWCALAAPLAAAFALRAPVSEALRALPWLAWLVLGPVALLGGFVYLLCLHAMAQVVQRALLSSNWLMRVSAAGLVLKLRSYQNAHFPSDGPTVARLLWPEVAAARRVRERADVDRESELRLSWLELELCCGTDELARVLAHERERPAPQRTFLGIKGRARFGHVPVFVAAPGRVRIEWLGSRVLRALARHVSIGEASREELGVAPDGSTLDVDTQLRDLCRRGQRLAAASLARRELGLSLTEARSLVARVSDEAA